MSQYPPNPNPYGAPQAPSPKPTFNDPRGMISGPAIGLMVVSIIWIALMVLSIAAYVLIFALGMASELTDPNLGMGGEINIIINVIWAFISLSMSLVVLYGAIQMKKLNSFGISMAAAIIALIPCLSPCYLLGIPFGIWALVVMNKPEVKQAFK